MNPDKKTTGLYNKFSVARTDGSSSPGGKHDGCEYFVLDLTHDPFAVPALRAYAAACASEYPQLSDDLFAKVGWREEPDPLLNRAAEAALRMVDNDYQPWDRSGGPNECVHGVAAGIACRSCDEEACRAYRDSIRDRAGRLTLPAPEPTKEG